MKHFLYLHKFFMAWILLFLHKQGAVGEWIPAEQSNILTLNLNQDTMTEWMNQKNVITS